MINNLNLLTTGLNYNKSQRPRPSEAVQSIQNSLYTGQKKLEDLTKEEHTALRAFESADRAAWFAEIIETTSKAENIARKIVKGETLTAEEEQFINQTNPQLKREAEEAKEYSKELARQLKSAKSKQQQSAILSSAVSSVTALQNFSSPIQTQLKMDAILQAQKEAKVEDTGGHIITGLKPGSLFDQKS